MKKILLAAMLLLFPVHAHALVKVVDYGAVCDGITDDLAAINAAIVAAGTNDVIQFPKGVCRISNTITHWDSGAAPVKHILRGEGPYSTFIWHTGNQATGAIRIESDAVLSGANWFSRQAGGVCLEDISIGSVGGPALTQFFSNRNIHHNVGFFSAHPDHPYFSIQGSIQGTYYSLRDLRGGDALPNDVVALMDQTGARTDPKYGVEITSGDYAHDGLYGASIEHFFFELRMNGGPARESVRITKANTTTGNMGDIYFIGCKIDAPANDGGTDYPGMFVDGAYDVHWIGGTIEQGNGGLAKCAVRIDNQKGNSFVYISDAFMESSGYIDIGTSGNANGPGKMELSISNSHFYKLYDRYNGAGLNILSLVNTKWSEQPSGVYPNRTNLCTIIGSYVFDGTYYVKLNISSGGVIF